MHFSRRNFLKSSALGLGAASFLPMPAMAAGGGYKALVCVFLYGGMDSHDMLIGRDSSSYAAWASAREAVAERYGEGEVPSSRERRALLGLGPERPGEPLLGLAPEMAAAKELYDRGRLAFVSNVGPLEEVTDRAAVENKTARLPAKLRSHNDQSSVWQTFGTEGARFGWGGRLLDASAERSTYAAISTSGHSVFLSGSDVQATQVNPNGRIDVAWGTNKPLYGSEELTAALNAHYARSAEGEASPFMRDIARSRGQAVATTSELAELMAGASIGEAVRQPGNRLSEQLGTIADLIEIRGGLGTQRQIFFAGIGGWDTHKNQALNMPRLLSGLSEALASFQNAIDAAGLADQVTLFTASDFGRTLTSNQSGTDHGWGSHHIVMGGAVRGGQVVGSVPSFELEHDLDFRRGALIPSVATEQYGAELGRWFGLEEAQLDQVFKNRGRFSRQGLGVFR